VTRADPASRPALRFVGEVGHCGGPAPHAIHPSDGTPMSQDRWTEVDRYVSETLSLQDAVLDDVLKSSQDAGLPAIQVSVSQGKLLHLWARSMGAKRILELGTLGGYSSIWLARALPPGGRLVTLEYDAKHAGVARANFAKAGLADVVDLRVGKALDTLPKLAAENAGPFDFVFVDADKVGYPEYFRWSLQLARPGSVLVFDNVVRDGAVADPDSADANVQAVRTLHERIAAEPRVSGTTIQTVGSKGYDGLAFVLVTR
jgi:predicted O-methyltransferase YrrM